MPLLQGLLSRSQALDGPTGAQSCQGPVLLSWQVGGSSSGRCPLPENDPKQVPCP